MFYRLTMVIFCSIFFTACAVSPQTASIVSEARTAYQSLENQQSVAQQAPAEFQQATDALNQLNRLVETNADDVEIAHQAYLSKKRTAIATAAAENKLAREKIQQAELARKELLLEEREKDLQDARQLAAQKSYEAEYARQTAGMLAEEVKDLQGRVENLNAQQTERGLVLSLNSILFEFDKATLMPGAQRTLGEVANFLTAHPGRMLVVEGFTDSDGARDYNQTLSQARAEAVKNFLVDNGVERGRVSVRGYGEEFPVASNDTVAGRQQNRRVEIVVANEDNMPVAQKRQQQN